MTIPLYADVRPAVVAIEALTQERYAALAQLVSPGVPRHRLVRRVRLGRVTTRTVEAALAEIRADR